MTRGKIEALCDATIEEAREDIVSLYRQRKGISPEDAEDIGRAAVTKAARSYDATRGILFVVFARRVAERVAVDRLRKLHGRKRIERVPPPDDHLLSKITPAEFRDLFVRLCRAVALTEDQVLRNAAGQVVVNAQGEIVRASPGLVHRIEAATLSFLGWRRGLSTRDVDRAAREEWERNPGQWPRSEHEDVERPQLTADLWAAEALRIIVDAADDLLSQHDAAAAVPKKGHDPGVVEDVVQAVLRAAGVSGEGLDRWFVAVRKKRKKERIREQRIALLPSQLRTLCDFIDERVEAGDCLRVEASELHANYARFALDRGEEAFDQTQFGENIGRFKGVTRHRTRIELDAMHEVREYPVEYRGLGLKKR